MTNGSMKRVIRNMKKLDKKIYDSRADQGQREQIETDILIIGCGISGRMMSKRISMIFPNFSVTIIDRGPEDIGIQPFHLHRLIPEMPLLSSLKRVKFYQGIYANDGFKNSPTVEDSNQYSLKVFKRIQITNCHDISSPDIYVIDKKEIMDVFTEKTHNYVIDTVVEINAARKICTCQKSTYKYRYLVNTIPLPSFLRIADLWIERLKFDFYPFWIARYTFPEQTGLYQATYNSSSGCNISRASLMGQDLFIESIADHYTSGDSVFMQRMYSISDLPSLQKLYPGRFNLLPNRERKSLFYWMTQKHDMFCIGRFGAWTYKVANDVWDDTKFICQLIFNQEQVKYYENISKEDGYDTREPL